MSGNRNRSAAFFFALSNIGAFIRIAEAFFGRGNGAEKKAAVLDVVGAVLQVGLGVVAGQNPQYSDIIGQVGDLIDAKVDEMKNTGELPASTPPATAPDPTATEYDTLAEAAGATSASYPFVRQKTNGKFTVWPAISVVGGTKVYP